MHPQHSKTLSRDKMALLQDPKRLLQNKMALAQESKPLLSRPDVRPARRPLALLGLSADRDEHVATHAQGAPLFDDCEPAPLEQALPRGSRGGGA